MQTPYFPQNVATPGIIGRHRYVVFARNGAVDWEAVNHAEQLKALTSGFEYFP